MSIKFKENLEEEIFLLLNYEAKSKYIKVYFEIDYDDDYHLVMIKAASKLSFRFEAL